MVLRPAAEGTNPISGSCGVHASGWSLHDPQRNLESGLSSVHANGWPLYDPQAELECGLYRVHINEWPLHDPQADLECGLSRVHVNDWPLRESQAGLEAGRAYQEKPHSASTASQPPPAYLSSISSPIESLYAPRPDTTNNNMEDVERGQASVEPESAERQREKIRAEIQSVVVELLAKKEDEEDSAKMKDFISKVILYTLIFGFIYFVC